MLGGRAALVIAGNGSGGGVASYLEARRASIATLKVLGATSGDIARIYLRQIGVAALLGSLAGLAAGVTITPLFGKAPRQCRCSVSTPAGYCTGIEYPAKGTILPPRARCSASRGVVSRGSSVVLTPSSAMLGPPHTVRPPAGLPADLRPPPVCGT